MLDLSRLLNRENNPRDFFHIIIRLSRIQLKFREISSCFILETDFRFEFLVQNMHVLRISSTYLSLCRMYLKLLGLFRTKGSIPTTPIFFAHAHFSKTS